MACVCVGGGGGCSVASTTVQQYLTAFGYVYNPSDPLASAYPVIIAKHNPSPGTTNGKAWAQLAEACLRARNLLYCKSVPFDCGGASGNPLGSFQLAGQLGSTGISAGNLAATAAGFAGTTLSAVTFGAGAALTGIIDYFEAHAAAEARQANALCGLCPQFSQAMQQIDALVKNGSISQSQGIQAMQTLALQFKGQDAALTKACNAFCGYNAIVDCMADESSYLYAIDAPPPAVPSLGAPSEGEALPVVSGIVGAPNAPSPPSVSGNISFIGPPSSIGGISVPAWFWIALAAVVLFSFAEGT